MSTSTDNNAYTVLPCRDRKGVLGGIGPLIGITKLSERIECSCLFTTSLTARVLYREYI